MRRGSLSFLAALICGAGGAVAALPKVDLPKEIPDEPFEFTAGRIEFTNDTLIAEGGVTGRFERASITADRATGNTETGDLKLEGNIHFERDNIIWNGSGLDYNYITQTGDFGPSALNFDPVLMSVDRVERVSTNEYRLEGADFTTCPKDAPHFHVHAKEAELVDEKYLKARGVTVYVGKVPVFYVPYWRQKLERGIFSFKAGYGSEWGAYSLITATVPVTRNITSETDLNLYGRRGVGFGQGFSWQFPKAVGRFAAFYLKDEDPYSKYATPMDQALVGDERYRFSLEHLQRFTDEHYVNTKVNDLSDPYVLKEFQNSDYRRYVQPENYLSYVYGNSYIGSEAFINHRLDSFYDNTDRFEYSLDVNRSRIPHTPFYFQSENSVADLKRVYSSTNTVNSPYDARRVDSYNMITMPQRWGFLSLVPRATYRATYYSDTSPAFGGGEEVRMIPGAGMEASLEAAKVLSSRERWYGQGLRHKIQPYADYIFQDASAAPAELLQFDKVDTLRDENKVKTGLRNVLQTRRNGRVSRFIDLDLYSYYLIEDHGTGNTFDSLFADARMPLTPRWMVDVEGVWDWNEGIVPFFNTRVSYDRDDLILSLEHLYQNGIQSLWTPRVDLFPEEKFSLEGWARYDDRDNDLEEIALVGYVNHCCMRYGLGCSFYENNEYSLMFSIGLSAFPSAKISSSF